MNTDRNFPLPIKQYRWYVAFWIALMIGSLVLALVQTLWPARHALTWREVLVAVLLLLQLGIYVGILFRGGTEMPPRRVLIVYFVVNYAVWFVQQLLVPRVWWTAFAYMGQSFGMLPAKTALLLSAAPALVMFGNTTGWDLRGTEPGVLWASVAQWVSAMVLFVYVSHVIQTSQERGRLIAELEQAKAELEGAQQREAELAVLRERERLARDLHDSLGHALVALAVQLEAIQRLYRVDPERASHQVDEVKALVRTSMDTLRRTVAGLRAPSLEGRALRPALEGMCAELGERAEIEVDCRLDEGVDALPPALAQALWSVTQEALTNVEKHAQASRVKVALTCEPHAVALRVQDDGIGLPQGAETMPNRFGLRGMRERVEGLGGTLALKGDVSGTVVAARLPLVAAPTLVGTGPAAQGE